MVTPATFNASNRDEPLTINRLEFFNHSWHGSQNARNRVSQTLQPLTLLVRYSVKTRASDSPTFIRISHLTTIVSDHDIIPTLAGVSVNELIGLAGPTDIVNMIDLMTTQDVAEDLNAGMGKVLVKEDSHQAARRVEYRST
jgi:hypothetical protein